MINICTFGGKLTGEPERMYTQSNKCKVTFDIAVSNPFKKDANNTTADFFRCEVWGRDAETIFKHFHKGDGIVVSGRMENNNYTNREGKKIYGFVLKVANWDFGPKKLGTGNQSGYGGYSNPGGTINDGGYAPDSSYSGYPDEAFNNYPSDADYGYPGYSSAPPDGFIPIPGDEELPFK